MSWKHIKSFLIVLFFIINLYLIFSTNGFDFKKDDKFYTNIAALDDTSSIVKKNYGLSIDKSLIPQSFDRLAIIDVTNIIYTDNFKNSKYDFTVNGASFKTKIQTNTFSYNESNAKGQMLSILNSMGISDEYFDLSIRKSDHGVICVASERLSSYPIFNGEIVATFTPSKVELSGRWYTASKAEVKNADKNAGFTDITNVIIDMCSNLSDGNSKDISLKKIDYGYYVSHYDESKVSKSSSAIPCYKISTDDGFKYYYDALNGKLLNKEE